jgi:hypothetical protein
MVACAALHVIISQIGTCMFTKGCGIMLLQGRR